MIPAVSTSSDYSVVFRNDQVWLPAMRAICSRHHIDASELSRQALGSHVVFRAGPYIIKLFCPLWRPQFAAEVACLNHIRGLPIPDVVATGEIEEWTYIVETVIPGIPLTDAWGEIPHKDRLSVVEQLGELMRRLHNSPPLPELSTDWSAFLADRKSTCETHHGVEGNWQDWISGRVAGFSEEPFEPVLLHSDLTDEHVFLTQRNGRWHISGLIDFGDAMMGHPHYDFVAPLCLFTVGDPPLSRALATSYGLELTPWLANRLTACCLLHRYGRMSEVLRRCPVPDGAAFHAALWGTLQ